MAHAVNLVGQGRPQSRLKSKPTLRLPKCSFKASFWFGVLKALRFSLSRTLALLVALRLHVNI